MQPKNRKTCSSCGATESPDFWWPSVDGESEVCHPCWERETDAEWWEMAIAMSRSLIRNDLLFGELHGK